MRSGLRESSRIRPGWVSAGPQWAVSCLFNHMPANGQRHAKRWILELPKRSFILYGFPSPFHHALLKKNLALTFHFFQQIPSPVSPTSPSTLPRNSPSQSLTSFHSPTAVHPHPPPLLPTAPTPPVRILPRQPSPPPPLPHPHSVNNKHLYALNPPPHPSTSSSSRSSPYASPSTSPAPGTPISATTASTSSSARSWASS